MYLLLWINVIIGKILWTLSSCEERHRIEQTFIVIDTKRVRKGTATPMAHIDPVFILRFWRMWG